MTVEHGYRYIGATAWNEITGFALSRSLSNRLNRPYVHVPPRCRKVRLPAMAIQFDLLLESEAERWNKNERKRDVEFQQFICTGRGGHLDGTCSFFIPIPGKNIISSLLSNFSRDIYQPNMQVSLLPTSFAIFEFLPRQCASFPWEDIYCDLHTFSNTLCKLIYSTGLNYRFSISGFLQNRFLDSLINNFFFFKASIITMFTIYTTIITVITNIIFLFKNMLAEFTSIFTIENSEEYIDFKNSNSIKFLILYYAEIMRSPC